MKLTRIRVSNFRSLRDIDISLHDYTTLIGPNGAGKSSVLYALEWFFGDRAVTTADKHYNSQQQIIRVTLNFQSLSKEQQESFGEFALGENLELTREYNCEEGHTKYLGTAQTVTGFPETLAHTRIGDVRASYQELRMRYPSLDDLAGTFSKDDVNTAFTRFLNDPNNASWITTDSNTEASRLFQSDGAFTKSCKLIFIRGGQDITGELVSTSKTSLLSELTTSLIDPTRQASLNNWTEVNQTSLNELKADTQSRIESAVQNRTLEINQNLAKYDRRANIQLDPTSPEIEVRYPVSISTKIRLGQGELENIEDQGHGTQRAVLMAMVETLHAQSEMEGEDDSYLRILAVEEPEVYQHPIRAKSFSKTLKELSQQSGYQVLIATHSPSFISTDFIDSLRIMRNSDGYSTSAAASLAEIVNARRKSIDEVRTWLDRELPRGIAEAFFADLVLLVEGETDTSILPEISELMGVSFDELGIVCLHVDGKQNIPVFKVILDSLGLCNFIVADGDFCDDQPDLPGEKKSTSRRQTNELVKRTGLIDSNNKPLYQYGDASKVIGNTCIYKVDLEDELIAWGSYQRAYSQINPNKAVKNAHKYRRAVKESAYEDAPKFLKELVASIHDYVMYASK